MVSYTVGQVSVYLNGVKLVEGTSSAPKDFIASDGSAISGLADLSSGDVVEVVALSAFSPSDTVSSANGGTFNGNVSFGDNNITNVGSIALDSISADGSSITVSTDTALAAGVDIETSTTGKIKMKGNLMQNSTHQALILGG